MRSDLEMICYALEIDEELLAHAPELLADLEDLGSDSDAIVEVVESLGLDAGAAVIDLGCGKGAASFALASQLELHVLGVDLFGPFIDYAKKRAASLGVSDRCRFETMNILEAVVQHPGRDVAVLAALGDVLGPLDATVGIVRKCVKPGGFIVISDGYIREGGHTNFEGFENYRGYDEMRALLTHHGDVIVREIEEDDDEDDIDEAALIRARAEQLAEARPELGGALREFADAQADEYDYLDENLVGVIWVLQRAS